MTTIDSDAREALIDKLEAFPERLQDILSAATDEELQQAGPGGDWGGVEIICHLRDLEELFLDRIILMSEKSNPSIQVVEDSLWPIDRDYLHQDPLEAFQEFSDYRRQTVKFLLDADVSVWSSTGRHPQFGQLSIGEYAERVAARDADHEARLRAAVAQN